MKWSQARKALVAVAAFFGVALSQGLIGPPANHWASAVIAGLGAIGVYASPNASP